MEKLKINSESKIFIEFEIENNKFDQEIDLNFPISFIKADPYSHCLYLGFYNKPICYYDLNSLINFDNKDSKILTNMRSISLNKERRVGYVKNVGLVDINTSLVIDVKLNVSTIFVYKSSIYYGTDDGKCFQYDNEGHRLLGEIEGQKITAIFTDGTFIKFCSRNGNLLKICGDVITNENINILITCVETYKNFIYYGTATNILYRSFDNKLYQFSSEIRFIDYIRVINDDLIIIGGQYFVQIIFIDPYKLIYEFKFNLEVSGIEVLDNELFISSGSKLYRKKINITI